MCGRYDLNESPQMLQLSFMLDDLAGDYRNDDVRPTNLAPIIRAGERGRVVSMARWGLIPHWWKDPKPPQTTFNARAETVAEKPFFRSAFKHRRCLVPVSAFFEWQAVPGEKKKRKLRFASPDGKPLALAGLWEHWRVPETGEVVESYAVITTGANGMIAQIHDRMPVVLGETDWDVWLNPEVDNPMLLKSMLLPCPNEWLVVSPAKL